MSGKVGIEPLARGRYRLRTSVWLPVERERVFAFFAAAENLGKITPPELGFRIVTPSPVEMCSGALIDYRIRFWVLPLRWETLITIWSPPVTFVDRQLRGPYRTWIHTHRFTERAGGTLIEDEVVYGLPFGALGALAAPLVNRQLTRIFSYRQRRVTSLLHPVSAERA
jgi:ligand-binding SRPBCC domain-containing protein